MTNWGHFLNLQLCRPRHFFSVSYLITGTFSHKPTDTNKSAYFHDTMSRFMPKVTKGDNNIHFTFLTEFATGRGKRRNEFAEWHVA